MDRSNKGAFPLECTIFPAWQRLGNGAVASVPAPVACARNLDFWWSQISVPKGKRKGERSIWQRRFWEHAIRDERDLETTSLISVATPSATASSNILKTGRIQAFMRAMGDMVEPALGLWISTAGVGSDGAFQAGNAPLLLRSMS